jgi:hypothetical protein
MKRFLVLRAWVKAVSIVLQLSNILLLPTTTFRVAFTHLIFISIIVLMFRQVKRNLKVPAMLSSWKKQDIAEWLICWMSVINAF